MANIPMADFCIKLMKKGDMDFRFYFQFRKCKSWICNWN